MGTLARGQDMVAKLEAQGIRATTDPYLVAPPCVLVLPPNLRFTTGCGHDANWRLVCIAPSAQTADRTTWQQLDDLVDGAYAVLPVESADLIAYILNGKSYSAYLLKFAEVG